MNESPEPISTALKHRKAPPFPTSFSQLNAIANAATRTPPDPFPYRRAVPITFQRPKAMGFVALVISFLSGTLYLQSLNSLVYKTSDAMLAGNSTSVVGWDFVSEPQRFVGLPFLIVWFGCFICVSLSALTDHVATRIPMILARVIMGIATAVAVVGSAGIEVLNALSKAFTWSGADFTGAISLWLSALGTMFVATLCIGWKLSPVVRQSSYGFEVVKK